MNIFTYLLSKLKGNTHSKKEMEPIPIAASVPNTPVLDPDRYATRWYMDYNATSPEFKAKFEKPNAVAPKPVARKTEFKAPSKPVTVSRPKTHNMPVTRTPAYVPDSSPIDVDLVVESVVATVNLINSTHDDDDNRRSTYMPPIVDSYSSSPSSSPSYSSTSDSSSSYSSCDTSSSSSSSCDAGGF
jgi:hypothetical protein